MTTSDKAVGRTECAEFLECCWKTAAKICKKIKDKRIYYRNTADKPTIVKSAFIAKYGAPSLAVKKLILKP